MKTSTFTTAIAAALLTALTQSSHAGAQNKAQLSITNNTAAPVNLFYVDRDKKEQFVGEIPVKRLVRVPCPFGIVFVFRDAARQELRRVTVNNVTEVVILGNQPNVVQPGNSGVPNVVGMFKVDADIALRKAGLNPVFQPGAATNDYGKLGNVISQSLQPNSAASPGATITLTYFRSGRPVDNPVRVPFVVAKSRWHAERRLLDWGLIPQGIEQGVANDPRDYFMVLPLFGNQNPDPDNQRLAQPGSTVTFKYLKTDAAVGPYDANSPDSIPNIAVHANADDSFDVAWMRRDERTFVSHYTGPAWRNASHMQLGNALTMLGGLTKDPEGNMYLATLRKEYAPKYRWDEGYAPGIAHLLKIAPGNRSAQLLADLNQQQYSRYPIINPILTQSAFHVTGRLAYGNDAVAFFFAHNVGAYNNVHETSNLIAVGRDGSSRYNNGGAQHCQDVRLIFDGSQFVMAQVYDAGSEAHVGLSKLLPLTPTPLPQGERGEGRGRMTWTNHIAVLRVPRGSFLRLGGIAATASGYQVLVVHGTGVLDSSNCVEWNGLRPDVAIKVVNVPGNFEERTTNDFTVKVVGRPSVDRGVVVRPKLVDLKNGRTMAIWEQRLDLGHNNPDNTKRVGTFAAILDGNGNIVAGPRDLGNAPTQMSSDAFLLPRSGSAAWVSGDAANNRMMLCTVDGSLNVNSYPLSVP